MILISNRNYKEGFKQKKIEDILKFIFDEVVIIDERKQL